MKGPVSLPAVFGPILDRLPADAGSFFGATSLQFEPVACVERPFSFVLRLAVSRPGEQKPAAHLFVKASKPKIVDGRSDGMRLRVVRDYEINQRAYKWLSSYAGVGAVPPVACYPEHLAIVTQEVPGTTLLEYLTRNARWIPGSARLRELSATMAGVGRWVRLFQQLDPTADRIAVEVLREYVDDRLRRMVGAAGYDERFRHRVLSHIDRLASRLTPNDLASVRIHADLSLGNVLVADGAIVVLDFAMSRHGTRLHDLARLFLQLELLAIKPVFRSSTLRPLQAALLEGFDPALRAQDPLFRLLLLLHRVNNLGSLTFKPGHGTERLYNRLVRTHHRRALEHELALEA